MPPLTFESAREQLLTRRSLIENLLNQLEIDGSALAKQVLIENQAVQLNPADNSHLINASHAQLALELNRIDAALARNSTGVYGLCSRCGLAMDGARLAADPAAPLCSPCTEALAEERLAERHPETPQPSLAACNSNGEVVLGQIFLGRVVKIEHVAACLSLQPGCHGLLHLCEVAEQPIGQLYEYLSLGDVVPVKVIRIDELGHIDLSMKVSR